MRRRIVRSIDKLIQYLDIEGTTNQAFSYDKACMEKADICLEIKEKLVLLKQIDEAYAEHSNFQIGDSEFGRRIAEIMQNK